MKNYIAILILLFCACAPIQVHFSPDGSPTTAIVETVDAARRVVLVQAYSFTSDPIADALIRAHKRGVKVEVILDRSHRTARYTSAPSLRAAGIPVWIDTKHAIAHNKIMIIDGHTVITGSFNFSKAAEEKNAENLVIIRRRVLAEKFITNWEINRKRAI